MSARAVPLMLMLILAAPANAQALKPPPGEPPGIGMSFEPRVPRDLTEPNRSLRCAVESIDGKAYRFAFLYHGARGYVDPATGEARATEGRLAVAEDQSKLFSAYGRWQNLADSFEASSDKADAPFGRRVRLEMHRTDFEREHVAESRWALLVQAYFGWMKLTKAVGFCTVRSEPQQPLSEAETRDHLKRL